MEIENTGNGVTDLLISNVGSQTASVTVTTPIFDPGFRRDITVRSRSSERVTLPTSIQMSGNTKSNKGISVVANEEITVIGMNKMSNTAGGYLGIPTDSLGTQYYAVTYFADPLTFPNSQGISQIAVVSTDDGTVVTFALPPNPTNPSEVVLRYAGNNYRAGDVFSVNLQKFETVQVQSDLDLTATHIYSNKPIAAFSGNKFATVGPTSSGDNLVLQLPPVNSWGRNYVLPFYPEQPDGYFIRIIASDPNTILSFDGLANAITIAKPTSVVELDLPASLRSIVSDKPIQIVQFTRSRRPGGNSRDSSMIIVPAIEQYATEYVFQTPTSTRRPYMNHLIIIAPADKISGFRLTSTQADSPVSNQAWQNVPGTNPPMVFTSIRITSGSYRVSHEPSDTRFAAILYGFLSEESYALPLGFSLETLNSQVFVRNHSVTEIKLPMIICFLQDKQTNPSTIFFGFLLRVTIWKLVPRHLAKG